MVCSIVPSRLLYETWGRPVARGFCLVIGVACLSQHSPMEGSILECTHLFLPFSMYIVIADWSLPDGASLSSQFFQQYVMASNFTIFTIWSTKDASSNHQYSNSLINKSLNSTILAIRRFFREDNSLISTIFYYMILKIFLNNMIS